MFTLIENAMILITVVFGIATVLMLLVTKRKNK